jgi:pyruvate-ferredoxin/flavodoxin oxidoreductase
MAMAYQTAYVAQVSMGANKAQLLTALTEAEAFNGPSLIIAYAPCIAHGVHLSKCMEEEQLAVACGYWPLYRFNPENKKIGKPCLMLDSKAPNGQFRQFVQGEGRFNALTDNTEEAQKWLEEAEKEIHARYAYLQKLAEIFS